KRRIITAAALTLVLVVLPAISWFYLRGGLQWRKDAVAELGSFGQIRGAHIIYPDGTKEDQLKESVCVIHNFGSNPELTEDNKRIIETNKRLYDQFGKMPNGSPQPYFKIVMIFEGGSAEFRSAIQTIPSIDYATWVRTGGLGSWGTILNNGYEKFAVERKAKQHKEFYALADPTGQIRCFYNALDDEQITRMVQQIARLLPQQ
ncbi:MAG: hypothetical protein Q7T20_04985, partial [Saprospiraceae bacterium]|nr:hypothetical protein [Saprospiraceae bacterium]